MKGLKENILTKTYQGNLKTSSETKQQLQFISKGCNEVYNYFLRKRIKTDKKNQPQPTSEEQQKDLDNRIFLSQGNYKGKRQPQIIIPFELTNLLKGKPTIITISWKKEQWKINLTSDIEIPPQISKSAIKRMNGVDRGERKLFANSEGW
ncbi:6564_t:CDS:2, partial [Cetraspora pellucida]